LIYAAIKNADAELADELAVLHHRLTTERLKKVLFSNTSDGSNAPNLEFVQTDGNFPERYSASLTAYNLARKEEE
jgi:hypothetical protein